MLANVLSAETPRELNRVNNHVSPPKISHVTLHNGIKYMKRKLSTKVTLFEKLTPVHRRFSYKCKSYNLVTYIDVKNVCSVL